MHYDRARAKRDSEKRVTPRNRRKDRPKTVKRTFGIWSRRDNMR